MLVTWAGSDAAIQLHLGLLTWNKHEEHESDVCGVLIPGATVKMFYCIVLTLYDIVKLLGNTCETTL